MTRISPRVRVVLPAPESPTTPSTIGRTIGAAYLVLGLCARGRRRRLSGASVVRAGLAAEWRSLSGAAVGGEVATRVQAGLRGSGSEAGFGFPCALLALLENISGCMGRFWAPSWWGAGWLAGERGVLAAFVGCTGRFWAPSWWGSRSESSGLAMGGGEASQAAW